MCGGFVVWHGDGARIVTVKVAEAEDRRAMHSDLSGAKGFEVAGGPARRRGRWFRLDARRGGEIRSAGPPRAKMVPRVSQSGG